MVQSGAEQGWSDYFCCGTYEYTVMAVDAGDYYTQSTPVFEKSLPRYALLVPVDNPQKWLLLKWNQDTADSYTRTSSSTKEFVMYQGRENPVASTSFGKTATNAFKYKLTGSDYTDCREGRDRLEELDGATVLFKNRRGDRYFGTLDAINTTNGRQIDVSFQIIETDHSEAVAYL